MKIENFDNMRYCETVGLSKCFKALSELAGHHYIEVAAVGFNDNSGYVYIATEDVTICSMLGRDVEYSVDCPVTGEEFFFDNYEEIEAFSAASTNFTIAIVRRCIPKSSFIDK